MIKVLIFDGPPGAGKSTTIKILAKLLNDKGCKTLSLYGFKRSFFSSLFERILCKLMLRNDWVKIKEFNLFPMYLILECANDVFKRLFRLWLILDVLGLAFKMLILRIRIDLTKPQIVLIEDCIPSITLDYAYISYKLTGRITPIAKRCIRILLMLLKMFCRRKRVTIINLYADIHELFSRYFRRRRIEPSIFYISAFIRLMPILCRELPSYIDNSYCIEVDTTNLAVHETVKILIKLTSITDQNQQW